MSDAARRLSRNNHGHRWEVDQERSRCRERLHRPLAFGEQSDEALGYAPYFGDGASIQGTEKSEERKEGGREGGREEGKEWRAHNVLKQ